MAIFYGLEGNLPEIFEAYRSTPGHAAVYIDLGYWGRREGGRWSGYHKVSVNARHPTAYLMSKAMPPDRISRFGLQLQDPRFPSRGHFLVAGMGDKGARAEGFEPEEWERAVITRLRAITDRTIVYRPKPSWKAARPIEGTRYSHRNTEVQRELDNCCGVLTHHSNTAVEAIVAGIPVYCEGGAGHIFSVPMIDDMADPWQRTEFNRAHRQQWMANLAYCQWSVAEMTAGLAWKHLRARGLI